MTVAASPEFSRLVGLDELEVGEIKRTIEADEQEREALAERFGLLAIGALRAKVALRIQGGGPLVRVEGRLIADVVQRCVVSLKPVPGHIEEEFAETYGPPDHRVAAGDEEAEVPEAFDAGGIDIGELVAQALVLLLESYPRADGVDLSEAPAPAERKDVRRKPFAELGEMMKKRN